MVAARGADAPDVFVVGGTVRDILLGEDGDDIDLAVEGDAIAFAHAARRGARRSHDAAPEVRHRVVVRNGDEHVDVVTTRRESYDAPGALPTVEHAGSRDDLHRRDFTINAMAASLRPERPRRGCRPHRRSRGPPRRRRPRAPRCIVRRRSDAHLPGDHVRVAVRARFDEHRSGLPGTASPRDTSATLLVPAAGRAGRSPRGRPGGGRDPPPRGAGSGQGDPSQPARRRRGRGVVRPRRRAPGRARRRGAVLAAGHRGDRAPDERGRGCRMAAPAEGAPPGRGPHRRRRDCAPRKSSSAWVRRRSTPRRVVALADSVCARRALLALAYEDRPRAPRLLRAAPRRTARDRRADLIAMGLEESPRIGEILGRSARAS